MLWASAPAVLSYYGKQVNASQANVTAKALVDLQGPLTDDTYGLLFTPTSRWANYFPTRCTRATCLCLPQVGTVPGTSTPSWLRA